MLKGDAGRYRLASGADSCQSICLIVVISWHVKEFAPLEVSAELLHQEAVAHHVCIFGVPVARQLLDHQIGVAIAQDPADAEFFGKPEPVNERLVFGNVVGGGGLESRRPEAPTDAESTSVFRVLAVLIYSCPCLLPSRCFPFPFFIPSIPICKQHTTTRPGSLGSLINLVLLQIKSNLRLPFFL